VGFSEKAESANDNRTINLGEPLLKTPIVALAAFMLIGFGSGNSLALGLGGGNALALVDEAAAASTPAYSSSATQSSTAAPSVIPAWGDSNRPFSTVGAGLSVSSLGVGIVAATPLSLRTNLRAGFNMLGYSRSFQADGIDYDGVLTLRSFETLLDWYPFKGSFHVSPGALIYNGNRLKANASVPANESFTLNGVSFVSDPAAPVTGTGMLKFNPAAPMALVGWGNVVPRTKRLSLAVEAGVVFQGSPKATLNLTGNVCDLSEKHCAPISADPMAQSAIQAEQNKLSNDVSPLQYYPVLRVGFGYKF
jgi:hypothetical protein